MSRKSLSGWALANFVMPPEIMYTGRIIICPTFVGYRMMITPNPALSRMAACLASDREWRYLIIREDIPQAAPLFVIPAKAGIQFEVDFDAP
jgi:hypothetical protein